MSAMSLGYCADQYDLAIFLITFPYADLPDHEEEDITQMSGLLQFKR